MENITIWDLYFAGIASIRFHPANDQGEIDKDKIVHELIIAATIADAMIHMRNAPCRGSVQ